MKKQNASKANKESQNKQKDEDKTPESEAKSHCRLCKEERK